jgi:mono/diheme cytochrome c family protein
MCKTRGLQVAAVLALVVMARSPAALPDAQTYGERSPDGGTGPQTISAASELYVLNCQGCHGARGEVANGDIRPLTYVFSAFTQTPRGRAYLIRVPGIAAAPIADGPLTQLLNYLANLWRSDYDAAQSIPRFSVADVSALRRRPLVDIAAERFAVEREIAVAHVVPGRTAK